MQTVRDTPKDYIKKMKRRDSSLAEGWGQIVPPPLYRQLEESKTGKSTIAIVESLDSGVQWLAPSSLERDTDGLLDEIMK